MVSMRVLISIGIVMLSLNLHDMMAQEKLNTVHVEVSAQKVGKIKLLLVGLLSKSCDHAAMSELLDYIQKDLSYTQQFEVVHKQLTALPTKAEFENLRKQGYELVLFIEKCEDVSFEWRLYDTSGPSMIKGKRIALKGKVTRGWAHALADAVWPELTSMPGFFSTKIAYCKDILDPHARAIKHICVADYDGSHEQILVDTHTLNVAPRWNTDPLCPIVFYSEHTNSNVRLMMATMDKKRRVVVNFDGLTMLPSFSRDGKRVAFCASRGDGFCDIYCYEPSGLKRLTVNQGNNIAPVFAEQDSKIYFCSDRTGAPQIYAYECKTGKIERITQGGYCVSPAYCEINKKLAYAKLVQGTMQLFVYDIVSKEHKQITFDAGNKEECSWSSCGNFLLFSQEHNLKSRIARINVQTGDKRFVTAKHDNCCYPAWSPSYSQLPIVS